MKKIILLISILLLAFTAFAQLKPPTQIDTFYVDRVFYKGELIRKEFWPAVKIIKEADMIRIAEQVYMLECLTNSRDYDYCEYDRISGVVDYRKYSTKCNGKNGVFIIVKEFSSDKMKTLKYVVDGYSFFLRCSQKNTNTGKADGKPYAHVKGRNTVGNIPRPKYTVQESGTVVVTIWVDYYGNVQNAVPGGDGTTVTDKTLWAAARKAAMETHFNMSADAPAMQEGTITYFFEDDNEEQAQENSEQPIPFQLVEEKPMFGKSDANAFSDWVAKKLKYPIDAKTKRIQGRVMTHFTINEDGHVSDVKILRGIEPSLDREAVRVVSSSPKWIPAKQKGEPVKVTITFPVIFKLR